MINLTLEPAEFKQSRERGNASLLEMFSEQVRLNRDKIAVTDGNGSLSYLDFYLIVRQTGQYLANIQGADEACIGLYCEPCIDMVCGAWGILASGNAYLPLAPEYPSERIRYMIQDSRVRVIYTQDHLKSQLQALVPEQVTLISGSDIQLSFAEEIASLTTPVFSKLTPESLAYVIYTSGSTGNPKGVMIQQRNIAQQMAFLKQCFSFSEHTRILQKTPMSFDAAQWEILAPVFGGHLIVGPAGCYRDLDAMTDTLLKYDISVLQCVPTLLQALVEHPLFIDCKKLKQVFSGGETLTRHLAKAFYSVRPETSLINLYGPTECTINSSYFRVCAQELDRYPSVISIGKPVAQTQYHILRNDGQPASVGEIGELYISGTQVAKGYLHRADLTAEKFFPNHISSDPDHARLYRSGDLARWDSDANVHFAGRVDNQVKLRGYRVELDEIRHAIEKHIWIKNAAMVICDSARTGRQNLIACVELEECADAINMRDPIKVSPAEMIREELMSLLPQYMIPNKLVILEKLPQTANGKVDYQALKALDLVGSWGSDKQFVPLVTETEKQLGEIWCHIMQWNSASAEDDFFECGGDSLTAVAMINRINRDFEIKIPLQLLFKTPTIKQLGWWIDSQDEHTQSVSRLIELNHTQGNPVFCWPGLGGSPMNLTLLATQLAQEHRFFGIQALGINEGETPLSTVQEMAKADIELIKAVQAQGPYRLWGYSFGAKLAFETAYQLEQMGETVEYLHLLAPGTPQFHQDVAPIKLDDASFSDSVFVTILFSVFTHKIEGVLLQDCLKQCHDENSFVEFMCQRYPLLLGDVIRRIIRIVQVCYNFSYTAEELVGRCINAQVTIFNAQQDNGSFIESAPVFSRVSPKIVDLKADHYQVLKEQGIAELSTHINNHR